MEKYKIEIKKSAAKELQTIPEKELKKIIKKICALAKEPRPVGSVKLTDKEQYRIRQGNYRILYTVEDARLVIFIVKVGHRKDVYKLLLP